MFKKIRPTSPFATDYSSYFLPWMVMTMVFLATLSLALGISLEKVLSKWENSITGSITIQMLPSTDEVNNKALFLKNVDALVVSLKGTPGIKDARALSEQEIDRLLNPWFGENELINDLPIPQVIDVTLADDIAIDLDVLKSLVDYQAENASIDIHQAWLKRLTDLIASVKMLTFIILAIILTATVILVIYATTTNVALHKKVIDLLHLIGSKDNYIAGHIALKVVLKSFKGAVSGFLLVIPVISVISNYIESFDVSLSSMITLSASDWFSLFYCVIFACLTSGASAYFTVIKRLKQML